MARNSLNLLVKFSEKGLSELKGGFKNLVGLGKSGASSFRNLKREAKAFESELKDVRRQIDGASGNITELVNREKQLERSLEGTNDELRKQGKLYEASKNAQAIRAKGADFRSRGRANAIGGAALLAPLAVAAKAGADFSSQMVDIQQKANLSDAATARMRNNIIDAARASAQMPSLTAQMKALGQSGHEAGAELIAMLQVVRGGTGTSAEAATAASDLLSKLTAPVTMKAFKKAGIDAFAAIERGLKNNISPLETMIALTEKATGGDNKKLQNFFADKEASKAMRQLMADYDKFGQMKKDIAAADGVTDQAFEQRMANDQNAQMRQLGSAGAGLMLAIAPVLTPALTALANAITPLANSVADLARENPGLAKTILMTVAGFGAARVALGGLQFAFGGVLGPMSKGYELWKKYRTLGSIAETFPKLATGVRMLGVAFRFLLGPVGLFLTVLAVVGVAVYRNWDTIKAAFNTGIAFLGGLRDKFLSIGKGMISGLVNGITSAPGRVWNALKSIVMNGVTNVKKLLGINSPSRLFMGFGGNLSEGMAIGIDRKRSDAFASARRLATGVAGAAALSSPAYAGGAGLGPSAAPVSSGPVTIQIYQQPGEDAGDLAQRVRRELEAIERDRRAGANSAFGD